MPFLVTWEIKVKALKVLRLFASTPRLGVLSTINKLTVPFFTNSGSF